MGRTLLSDAFDGDLYQDPILLSVDLRTLRLFESPAIVGQECPTQTGLARVTSVLKLDPIG